MEAYIGNDYFEENYKKPSTEALFYISETPRYEKLPASTFFLPQKPGAYVLPLGSVCPLWDYLNFLFNEYRHHGQIIPTDFFTSLPGVARIDFEKSVYCVQDQDDYGVIKPPVYMRIDGYWNSYPYFDVKDSFHFHSTIQGAITAFFLFFVIKNPNHLLICPNGELDHQYELDRYPDLLSEQIRIPWGLRVETIGESHYRISCLATGLGGPLRDLNLELKDGRIISGESPTHHPTSMQRNRHDRIGVLGGV